jgi:Armadillo/beta-catenin-like repeat
VNDGNKVELGNCGACEAVVGILTDHSYDEGIAAAACDAIQNLAANNKANETKLRKLQVREALNNLKKAHAGNGVLVNKAQDALAKVPSRFFG